MEKDMYASVQVGKLKLKSKKKKNKPSEEEAVVLSAPVTKRDADSDLTVRRAYNMTLIIMFHRMRNDGIRSVLWRSVRRWWIRSWRRRTVKESTTLTRN